MLLEEQLYGKWNRFGAGPRQRTSTRMNENNNKNLLTKNFEKFEQISLFLKMGKH